ncbi:DUF2218 domain-containing protein [Ruegeria sp. 2205SS24-7]|uniref:DUF2218 domain-containing protein n=1 Tax=Ruegeria discodermiae TaxID=3064389 RepID=UPI0027413B76|nr:DUF2218 domain-containing protein [Ruegeria sp. 2205SS24-7]MDP5219816.1 DUF2218 domain-containing protein [Ruegeria sp. 2205SS24-7]
MQLHSTFSTQRGGRYLSALCHHFGRKVEAWCDADTGWVTFPFGRCDLKQDVSGLRLVISATSQADLDRVVQVVTSHLERFAFLEHPELEWNHPAETSPSAMSEPTPHH